LIGHQWRNLSYCIEWSKLNNFPETMLATFKILVLLNVRQLVFIIQKIYYAVPMFQLTIFCQNVEPGLWFVIRFVIFDFVICATSQEICACLDLSLTGFISTNYPENVRCSFIEDARAIKTCFPHLETNCQATCGSKINPPNILG